MDPQVAELVHNYKAHLGELTFNSKPIITNLTIIAGENLAAATFLGAVIVEHILTTHNVGHKLPALYLMDSIVKNIGRHYTAFFSEHLLSLFSAVYVARRSASRRRRPLS
eukprot:scaffold6693_cov323-Prasinococcus_capsulatus_cf.AAC.1